MLLLLSAMLIAFPGCGSEAPETAEGEGSRNTFSIEKSALISDIARGIFGNNRTGTRITSKVNKAIEYMKDKNHIIEENGTIKLKSQ